MDYTTGAEYTPYDSNGDAARSATMYNSTALLGDDNDSNSAQLTISEVIYYFISLFILVVFCFCSRSRIPDDSFIAAATERRAQWVQQEERKDRMSDKDYRIGLVLRGLVIKRIIEEKEGFLTLGDDHGDNENEDQRSIEGSISLDSMDEKTSTCAICLEPFRVGDVVGLSRTLFEPEKGKVCNHAFHKDCIISWLMQPTHDECPSCRSLIVEETDEDRTRADSKETKNNDSEGDAIKCTEFPDHHANFVFVIMHGLVARVKRASYSLIGQSINTKRDEDIEMACCGSPPSPMRRVFSLEGLTQPRQRSVPARRRTSIGSMDEDPADSIKRQITLPDTLDDSSHLQNTPPADFRRVVSDFTGLSSAVNASTLEPVTASSTGGVNRLSFRPRAVHSNNGLTFDASQRSEDDIIIREVLPHTNGRPSKDEHGHGDVIHEHEIS